MDMPQLIAGLCSGAIIDAAVGSHAISRAAVLALIAGVVIGDIAIDGVEGYLRWVEYIPTEMAKFSAFWGGMTTGFVSGASFAARIARSPRPDERIRNGS